MQAPNWTDFLQCSICTNKFNPSDICPISLSCGHTLCTRCLSKLKTRTCPYDKAPIRHDAEMQPPNIALLQLLGHSVALPLDNAAVAKLSLEDQEQYKSALHAIGELAMVLKPLAEHGTTAAVGHLTKPMLKKLVTVVNCQVLEGEGRARALRAARSIADRTVTELLVMHQNQQQISTLLWTAVRNRGCQFLGPVMQEEAIKLILRVLESGNSLSRKNIVLFVVQRLSIDFPQASKTSIGHVVQLLYRASCFNVEKRDDDSSLMQLKEEFRVYESLRREHDSQIIRMAMEAGLRISPEQWSTLLYGDHKHKSDMQSIIDKLVAQGAASSGLSELIVSIGRSQDPYQLSEKVLPHLETILKVQVDKDGEVLDWENFASVMMALVATLQGFSAYMQIQSGRFKTGMCPHLSKPGGCPKGDDCTYAHTEEERDKFRSMVKPASKPTGKPRSGDQFSRSGSLGRLNNAGTGACGSRNSRYSGEHGAALGLEGSTPFSSLSSIGGGIIHSGPNSLQEPVSPEVSYQPHLHTSGSELPGFRFARHSGPITAPVLPSQQDWVPTVHRGVATANHVYASATVPSPAAGAAGGMDYHHKRRLGDLPYSFSLSPQLLDLDLLKMQHEAVKQSVEAASYSRDFIPPSLPPTPSVYRSGSRQDLLTSIPVDSRTYTLPPPSSSSTSSQHGNLYTSFPAHELMTSGLVQDSAIGAAISQQHYSNSHNLSAEQSLLSGIQQMHLALPNYTVAPHNILYSTSTNTPSSGATVSASVPVVAVSTGITADTSSHPTPPQPNDSSVCTSAPSYTVAVPVDAASSGGVSSSGDAGDTGEVRGGSKGQEDLEAEIRRLKEQLRESNVTIQHQQAQLQYSGPQQPPPPPPPTSTPQPLHYRQPPPPTHHHHYPTSTPAVPATVLLAGLEDPAHQVSSGQGQSSVSDHAYGGSIQYSQQQLQAAVAALVGRGGMGAGIPQATGTSYNPVPSYSTQPWSGSPAPLGMYGGASSVPLGQHSSITPPGTGYVMPATLSNPAHHPLVVAAAAAAAAAANTSSLPLSSGLQLTSQEHPDDVMLAAYIQMLEQNKAAGHAYQTTPTYASTPGQYYFQQ